MAEANQASEDSKQGSKVQIPSEETKTTLPIEPSSASAGAAAAQDATGEEIKAGSDGDDNGEEEEFKGPAQPTKIINQAQSNIPIANPEVEEYKELLEQNMPVLKLTANEKTLLMGAIERSAFKKTAELIVAQMNKNRDWERASALEDLIPLFEPHLFWDNQPVPKSTDEFSVEADKYDKPIEVKSVDDVSETPYTLPAQYEWDNLDLANDEVAGEVYELLVKNYVEDDDAMFRFDYSIPFLRWALMPPNGKPEWIVGVRAGARRKLFGLITGIPVHMNINGSVVMCAEINFLCVHKDLRTKRLAPVLIKEITRRVNRCNIWQAVYTSGTTIPTPFTGATYWHRSLNPKKLIDVRFSSKPSKQSLAGYLKKHSLPSETSIQGLRPMQEEDLAQVTALLNNYLSSHCKVYIMFTEDEVRHFFLPREEVVYCYVDGGAPGEQLTDIFSFYYLPSQILNHPEHNTLKVAYSYYNISTTDRLKEGMQDMLIKAKGLGFDVFNALDVMENLQHFEELKFGIGDGLLHYYLYNWRVRDITPGDIGIVLV